MTSTREAALDQCPAKIGIV